MSAVTEPYRSELSAGRDGLAQPLHAEWTKFRTARGLIVGAMLAILVMVLLSLIGPLNSHSTIANPSGISVGHPYVPTGPDGEAVTDSFYFVHQPLAGNGTVTVRLSSLTGHIVLPNGRTEPGLEPWAKAGVIVKENTEQGSPYAAVMVTGAHGVRLQYDYTHDIGSDPASQVALAAPRWLRLMRSGDLLTGYESSDGIHWRSVGSAHLAGLPRTVQAGLFVASPPHIQTEQHLGGTSGTMQNTLATAVFDHLGVRGNSPSGTWSGTDVGGGASGSPFDAGAYSESNGLYTVSGSGDIAADVSAGPRVESTLRGTFAGLIVVIVLASGFVTAEYRRGLIRTTLTASPRRGRVLAAKAIVVGAVTFACGLVGAIIALPLGEHILRANGNYILPASWPTQLRVIAGTAAMFAVVAILALALGTILRRSAGAITAVIALIVVPYMLAVTLVLPTSVGTWLLRLSPAAAFAIQQSIPAYPQVTSAAPIGDSFPLAPWTGFAVLCAYAGLALALAVVLLRRRDA